MRKILLVLFLVFSCATPLHAQDHSEVGQSAAGWRPAQAENLLHWIRRAGDEAIVMQDKTENDLRRAIDSGDRAHLDQVADAAALRLLSAYHGKCCGAALPARWHISPTVSDTELRGRIDAALAADRVDLMLRANRPRHPHYRVLAEAYGRETDQPMRALLALNLTRWRSLPLPANGRYLIVNAAAQELTLWEGTTQLDMWRIIVGKTSSPTPVFSAEVTGVVLNPWWEIPSSIAAEGIAAFVRRSPIAARAKGYIYGNGRYRQMPGDNNALGRMKLVMPNRFTVFLHDTSNRALFERDERTLSHGCVRVDRALDFASVLLDGAGWTREGVDEAVASDVTRTVSLSQSVPLFIAYFTAEPDGVGGVRQLPDIYRRDGLGGGLAGGLSSGLRGEIPAQFTDLSVSSCSASRAIS